MPKAKKIELDNGLKVIFIKDTKKHLTSAFLTVNVGGLTKRFNMDGKGYEVKYGLAHFLEHYLLENSIYGNIMEQFGNDYIEANGFTAPNRTVFYISTVHDFEDNLVKLINVVNNPKFDNKKIEDVKVPVLREIDKSLDNPHRLPNKISFEDIFKEIPYDPTLGDKDEIRDITVDDIKLFHKAFYNSNNELLVIAGNFDEEKITELIKKTYKDFSNKSSTVKDKYKEIDKVVKDRTEVEGIQDYVKLTYKINIGKIKPKDKDKLSYYVSYMFFNNFSERTELFKYIMDNKISSFSLSTISEFGLSKDYLVLNVFLYTDKFDIGTNLLFDKMNNLEYNDNSFKIWKDRQIIHMINSLEKFTNVVRDYMDNVYLYDLYMFDDIKFIKKLNIDECRKLIGGLDFSNYNITICHKKNN